MATDFASESGHWYQRDGTPKYTIVGGKNGERPTTLRDARVLDLVPSVTTIIRSAAAPALERWKAEQLLLAALTLPRRDGEGEADWLQRVREDSRAQAIAAADRGTAVHGAIERAQRGDLYDNAYVRHVGGVHEALFARCSWQQWLPERSFAHPLGYGGKCDLHSPEWVVDYKTKEFAPDAKLALYDEHLMQLAAYREGLSVPKARCAILFVSVSHPGTTNMIEVPEADLERGWSMFRALLTYWQARNRHGAPQVHAEAA